MANTENWGDAKFVITGLTTPGANNDKAIIKIPES